MTFKPPEGIDKKYLTINNIRNPLFDRNPNKVDANIKPQPEGLIRLNSDLGKQEIQSHLYNFIVNEKVQPSQTGSKFTFETQELYNQANHLCQQIPHWKTDAENPINQYIPESKRPFQNKTEMGSTVKSEYSNRASKLMSLS